MRHRTTTEDEAILSKVDLRGHFHRASRDYLASEISRSTLYHDLFKKHRFDQLSHDHDADPALVKAGAVLASMEKRMAVEHREEERFGVEIGYSCTDCGQDVRIKQEPDGERWRATTECRYPEGMPAYSVEIDIHSGKIAFANDFRRIYPVADDFYINVQAEIRRCTEAYAAQGCIHVFVGNTCPEIRQLDMTNLLIGVSGPDQKEEYNEETKKWTYTPFSPEEIAASLLPGEERGSICTDLWWFSAADLEDVWARAKKLGLEDEWGGKSHRRMDVVEVQPGRYRTTVYFHLLDRDAPGKAVYATIERMGDVQGTGFLDFPKADRPFEREILLSRLAFPSLYPIRSRVLDHYFCTNGNGMEWYDGVLIGGDARREAAKARLEAGEEVTWETDRGPLKSFYPLSGYSHLANVPDDVKPDWLRGVYETLDLILATDPTYEGAGGWKNSHNIEFAKKVKAKLDQRFGPR